MTPPLGDRASFLLGMLIGSPRCADELHVLIGHLVDDHDDLLEAVAGISPNLPAALVSLYDAGPSEVRRLLDRLAELGLADRVELDGSAIFAYRTLRP